MGPTGQLTPPVIETETEPAALTYGRGQSSPTARLPAVRSSRCDLRDLAHLLSHLASPIADGKDDGGGNGGAARRDDGETSVKATVTQTQARTSIYELWLAYCALKRGMGWSG